MDDAPESPAGRRRVRCDRAVLASREEHRPKITALDLPTAMGGGLLTEEKFLALQKPGEFVTKTSGWIATLADFREQGGALPGGRSYGRLFIGGNGAQSYQAASGGAKRPSKVKPKPRVSARL